MRHQSPHDSQARGDQSSPFLRPLPFPFSPRFFGLGCSTSTGVVGGGGGGTTEVVGGGVTEVLVVTGSGTAGRDAESTMNAIATTKTAITAAVTINQRDLFGRTGGGAPI